MELADARHLAIAQMKRYQLWRWSFRFSGEKRAFGRCDFGTQTIYLSKHYVLLNEEPQVRDAILHEIAHALAGHEAGHGPKWRRVAARLGAAPRRCVSQDDVTAPPPAYLLECPNCGVRLSRYRRPSQPLACGRCCDRHNGGDYHARFRLQLKRAQA